MLKVLARCIHVIAQKRAAGAAFLPVRAKHEVIHKQLVASVEQLAQRYLSLRRVKNIQLRDLDPGQGTSLPGQFIVGIQVGFFLRQQRFPRLQPLFLGDDGLLSFHEDDFGETV